MPAWISEILKDNYFKDNYFVRSYSKKKQPHEYRHFGDLDKSRFG